MNDLILEINIDNLKKNLRLLKKDKQIIAMVKANAYGVGIDVIKYMIEEGVNYFGVSTLYEAIELRQKYPSINILIFTPVEESDLDLVIEHNLTLIVSTMEQLKQVRSEIKIHLKFDTAMGRLGFFKEQVSEIEQVIANKNLQVQGILTHFAQSSNREVTEKQIFLFKQIVDSFTFNFELIHLQNSLGSANYDIDFATHIRPGIAMYGLFANKEEADYSQITLFNVLSLKARVIMSKDYDGKVSYDLTQHVKGTVATLRIGYTDGLLRAYQGYSFSNGNTIVGRVCMCQTLILVNEQSDYQYIFKNAEDLYRLVAYVDTITYEFLVSMSARTKRVLQC